jgi:hypothetical protein
LEAILRPPSHGQIDAQEKADEHSKHNGVSILKMDEIKVRPEGEQTLTFESNGDGSLDADLVDAIIKGTIAFKYRIKDNVWRIISKSGDIFPRPPDGWGDREYIPIKRQVTPPDSPIKTPLTPANSLAPPTPVSMHNMSMNPNEYLMLQQISQQIQTQMHLNEQFGQMAASQQLNSDKTASRETREELMQRHGFR